MSDAKAPGEPGKYVMRISRLTVEKLGVKLYDTVSAAIAELVANAYDADAEHVRITTRLGGQLAESDTIEVVDDGHGMTPAEALGSFLVVGRDRRRSLNGRLSREKCRPVMGRKGIGKLAPFGICQRIEVISAGGAKTEKGYEVTHFTMDFDRIVTEADENAEFDAGKLDRTFLPKRGTTMRLSRFLKKRVPPRDVLERQLGRRFTVDPTALSVTIVDLAGASSQMPPFEVPMRDGTTVDLSTRPVELEDGTKLQVTGKIGMAIQSYANEEMAGVRIYARGKIVATTRDFEQPAGFTGEFTTRSYLVGSVHAEWLDLDSGDDLVRTDRQGILWESEYGSALRRWGAALIKEVAKKTQGPRRQLATDKFLGKADFKKRASERFSDSTVVDAAIGLAKKIGAFASQDDLEDDDYVKDLSDVILSVAPHKALMDALQEFSTRATGAGVTIAEMASLFGKSRVAEMASYSQIAAERVRIIEQLEAVILADPPQSEMELLNMIAAAPWLIEPTWAAVTANQGLSSFAKALQKHLKQRASKDILLSYEASAKRPDFILISVGSMMHLVELKKVGKEFDDADCDRLLPYFEWLDEFFANNQVLVQEYAHGYRIDLIADHVNLKVPANKQAMKLHDKEGRYRRRSWNDFLAHAKNAHQQFLVAREVGKSGKV